MRLLLATDSDKPRIAMEMVLSKTGYVVDTVQNGTLALKYIESFEYTVVILDLLIPETNALEILKRLRSAGSNAQVLIISSKKQVQERIAALELGVGDYLIKPINNEELVARVDALISRYSGNTNPIVLGNIELDTFNHTLHFKEIDLALTVTEQKIFEYLAAHRGAVVSMEMLEQHIYDSRSNNSKNSMEVHISSIRKKIAQHTDQPVITTRRGFGYVIQRQSL